MAASNTASAALALARVSSGSGEPVSSMAMPPRSASSKVNVTSWRTPIAPRTLTASAVISGPMPSPGSRQIE